MLQNIIRQAEEFVSQKEAERMQEQAQPAPPQESVDQSSSDQSGSDDNDYSELGDRIGFLGAGQVSQKSTQGSECFLGLSIDMTRYTTKIYC